MHHLFTGPASIRTKVIPLKMIDVLILHLSSWCGHRALKDFLPHCVCRLCQDHGGKMAEIHLRGSAEWAAALRHDPVQTFHSEDAWGLRTKEQDVPQTLIWESSSQRCAFDRTFNAHKQTNSAEQLEVKYFVLKSWYILGLKGYFVIWR